MTQADAAVNAMFKKPLRVGLLVEPTVSLPLPESADSLSDLPPPPFLLPLAIKPVHARHLFIHIYICDVVAVVALSFHSKPRLP